MNKKNIIIMIVLIAVILSLFPITALAAPDTGFVNYMPGNEQAGYHRREYIAGAKLSYYKYGTAPNYTPNDIAAYYIAGAAIDTPMGEAARKSGDMGNWDEIFNDKAHGWGSSDPKDQLIINYGGTFNTLEGRVADTTNPEGKPGLLVTGMNDTEKIQTAFSVLAYMGYPFNMDKVREFGITEEEAQYATNFAFLRLGSLFYSGYDKGTVYAPNSDPYDLKSASGLIPNPRGTEICHYAWYLEQEVRKFLVTGITPVYIQITPSANNMTSNADNSYFEKTVNLKQIKSGTLAEGSQNVFAINTHTFPAGSIITYGSNLPVTVGQFYPLNASGETTLTVKVPINAGNSGKTYSLDVITKTMFSNFNVQLFRNGGVATGYFLSMDKPSFPLPADSYKNSAPTKATFTTPAVGHIDVKTTGEGSESSALANCVIGLYQNNVLVSQGTTNANGDLVFGPVAPGNYDVREITPAANYFKNETNYPVTVVGGARASATLPHTQHRYIDVTTTGEDADVSGLACSVSLLQNGSVVESKTTSASGTTAFGPLRPGSFVVRETSVPNPYILNTTDFPVSTAAIGRASVSIPNVKAKGKITITRHDSETGNTPQGDATLNGAKYEIYQGSTLITTITTLSDTNVVETGLLPLGTYTIKEIGTPTGYIPPTETINATLTYANNSTPTVTTSCIMQSPVKKGYISVVKFGSKDIEPGSTIPEDLKKPLKDVEFTCTLKSSLDVYDVFATDENGRGESILLPYGTYEISETKTPEGYYSIAPFDLFISENDKEYFKIIENDVIESVVRITKLDEESGLVVPVAGTTFRVLDSNKNPIKFNMLYPTPHELEEFETDASGMVYLPALTVYGQYYLQEIKAPYGYTLNQTEVPFKINEDTIVNDIVDVQISNANVKGHIIIGKTLDDGSVIGGKEGLVLTGMKEVQTPNGVVYEPTYEKRPLKGVEYQIIAADNIVTPDGRTHYVLGDVVDTLVTDVNGYAKSVELYLGKYILKETKALDGYYLDPTEHEITLEYHDQLTPIINIEKQFDNNLKMLDIGFVKYAESKQEGSISYSYDVAEGFAFGLYAGQAFTDLEGNIIISQDTLVGYAVSDENGKVQFNQVPAGVYYIKEFNTNPVYIPNEKTYSIDAPWDSFEEEIKYVSINNNAPVENTLIKKPVVIYNHDINDEKVPLQGEFEVYENGKVIFTGTADEDGFVKVPPLPIGDYVIKQITPPLGYAINPDEFKVSVTNDEATQYNVKVPNKPTQVIIVVVDKDTGLPLKDAEIEIKDSNGIVVGSGKTNEKGELVINKLPIGDYTWKEIDAPDGYGLDDTEHHIVILPGGDIEGPTQLPNEPTKVRLFKLEETSDKKLAGVHIKVVSDTDNVVFDGKTDENGEIYLYKIPVGRYIWQEVKAPDGYILNKEKLYFQFDKYGKVTGDFEMYNFPTELTIHNYDKVTNAPLVDGEFELIDNAGKAIHKGQTDVSGNIVIPKLPFGDYTVKQTKAPHGYAINEEIFKVSIIDDGKGKFTVRVPNITTDVVLLKVNEKGEPVKDATIEVYNEKNEMITSQKTNDKGQITVKSLAPSKYYFIEVSAPQSYSINKKPVYFEVKSNAEIVGETKMIESPTRIKFIKTNTNKEPLTGAVFGLYNAEGRLLERQTSGPDGRLQFEGFAQGKYFIREMEAPNGYRLSADIIEITVTDKFTNPEEEIYITDLKYGEVPSNGKTPNNNGKSGTGSQTGQDGLPFTILLIGIGAAIAVLGVIAYKKDKERKEKQD